MPNRLPDGGRIQGRTRGKEITDEVLGIFVDAAAAINGNMAAANHDQILHQIRMETTAEIEQDLLFVGAGRKSGIFQAQRVNPSIMAKRYTN